MWWIFYKLLVDVKKIVAQMQIEKETLHFFLPTKQKNLSAHFQILL